MKAIRFESGVSAKWRIANILFAVDHYPTAIFVHVYPLNRKFTTTFRSLVSILWSKPISKDGWVGFRPQDEMQIREDGSPSPRFEKVASMFMTSAAQQANKLERAMAERAAAEEEES